MITFDDFNALKKGDKLVDKHGRRWAVLSNAFVYKAITRCQVRCPQHAAEELRFIDLGPGNKGIMDEEIALLIELNDPKAFVEKS